MTLGYDKQQATHEFTKWSDSYDRSILQWLLFRPSHQVIINRIRAEFETRPLRILDVGCGTGVFAARIRESIPEADVWGVDLVAEMLQRGAERWAADREHLTPIQGDSERLPFAAGSFDVVTCANSFHHYPDQARAVQEMRRVLKPGGRLLLIDGYRDAPYGWFIYEFCVASIEGDIHHCTKKQMRKLLGDAGFGAVTQQVHRGPAPFLLTEGAVPLEQSRQPSPHFSVSIGSCVDFLNPQVTAVAATE